MAAAGYAAAQAVMLKALELAWKVRAPPPRRVEKIMAINQDHSAGETLVEFFRPETSLRDVCACVPWERYKIEVRYVLGGRKYRAVYRREDVEAMEGEGLPIPRPRMGGISRVRLVEARLVPRAESGDAVDVTKRVLKYMGPNGDFHASAGLRVKLHDVFPFDDHEHESEKHEALELVFSDGTTRAYDYADNPDFLQTYGQADVFLTGNPQITFFKSLYRRHSLFSIESTEGTFDGTVDFGKQPTLTLPRGGGDLVGAVWLEISVPDLLAYDITPTPSEGNTIDVTSLTSNIYQDSYGSYFQVRSGNVGSYTYANAVALHDGFGRYYSSGTSGNLASYSGNIATWPYMLAANTGNAAILDFSTPTTDLRYVNGIGLALVKSVELELGGSRLDKHYSEWWDIWSELTEKEEKLAGFNTMVGKYDPTEYASWKREHSTSKTLYVPLRFCYNRVPGLFLPLTALSYSQVKLNFEFRPYLECVKAKQAVTALTSKRGALPLSMTSCKLYADYVFLDAPERSKITEGDQEYLVEQLQFMGDEAVPSPQDPNGTVNRKYTLTFHHPVREIVWVYQAASNYDVNANTGNDIFNYDIPTTANTAGGSREVFESAKLVFNGSDRFSARTGAYFRFVQPYEHHTRVPSKSIYTYSFALGNCEDHQPNGTANFSKLDACQLSVTLNQNLPAGRLKCFARGYNLLRLTNGMGGLVFA